MLTLELFSATILLLFLSMYVCCYAKNLLHIRQQDIEFTRLMSDLDEYEKECEKEYEKV